MAQKQDNKDMKIVKTLSKLDKNMFWLYCARVIVVPLIKISSFQFIFVQG